MRAVDTRPEVVLTEETVQAVVVEAPVLEAPAASMPAPRAPVARIVTVPDTGPSLPPSIALPAGTSQVVLAAGT